MANRLFEVTITGWVAADPSYFPKTVGKGTGSFCTFPLIHTPRYRGSDGSWQEGNSLRVTVKCWGWPAFYVQQSVYKGQPMVVSGRLSRSVWEDKEGGTHYGLELVASSLGHDLSFGAANFIRMNAGVPRADNKPAPNGHPKSGGVANSGKEKAGEEKLAKLVPLTEKSATYQEVDPLTGEICLPVEEETLVAAQ